MSGKYSSVGEAFGLAMPQRTREFENELALLNWLIRLA